MRDKMRFWLQAPNLCGLDKTEPGMVVVWRVALTQTVQAVRLHDMLLLAILMWHGSHIEVH